MHDSGFLDHEGMSLSSHKGTPDKPYKPDESNMQKKRRSFRRRKNLEKKIIQALMMIKKRFVDIETRAKRRELRKNSFI
jgi:hypothetical protein